VDGADSAPASLEPRKPRPVRLSLALDLDYRVGLAGNDDRRLLAPHEIDYDGIRFPGPQRMHYDFDLQLGSASARGGIRFFDVFALEWLAGLSSSALHLVARAPGLRAGDTSVGLGGNAGARGTLTPHPVFDLYGEWRLHLLDGLQKSHELIAMTTAEVGTNVHLTRNVSLFGGWRWWTYDETVSHDSDVHTKLTGPTFGLSFRL
jgi:hypothetical protein